MISVFDIEKLNGLLKDFYRLTKIRITVYNDEMTELTSYPAERAPVCRIIRSDKRADEACVMCDRKAIERCAGRTEPYIYTCHAGLTEAFMALKVGSVIVGYLAFGHIFSFTDKEQGISEIKRLTAEYSLDTERLCAACKKCPVIAPDYILSAAHIMHAVSSLLIIQRMAVLRKDGIEISLDRYISQHFCEPLHADTLCDRFLIGRTRLYEILRRCYGCGLAEHIRALRIAKAKKLLAEKPELSVGNVAESCGYADYNYFITVFSRETGLSPGKYRQKEINGVSL